jgi:hypothetical protein
MEANDEDWREVALMLNGANEALTEKIHQLKKENLQLQAQFKNRQDLTSIINLGPSPNN